MGERPEAKYLTLTRLIPPDRHMEKAHTDHREKRIGQLDAWSADANGALAVQDAALALFKRGVAGFCKRLVQNSDTY